MKHKKKEDLELDELSEEELFKPVGKNKELDNQKLTVSEAEKEIKGNKRKAKTTTYGWLTHG